MKRARCASRQSQQRQGRDGALIAELLARGRMPRWYRCNVCFLMRFLL